MIYHKKPDGTIEQIETTDEENRIQKIQAYNLDKQLSEQRGIEFGTIYNDADSLPDEDKITLGIMTQKEYDAKQKNNKYIEIIGAFENNLSNGVFDSTILNMKVDCRRSNTKNDLQNVQGLISYMTRNSISTIDYVGYTEIKTNVTISMLETLVEEMQDYALTLYNKKWQIETLINSCSSKEELETINW